MIDYIGKATEDNNVQDESQIVICGCGKIGHKILQHIDNNRTKKQEIYFCDANVNKQGTIIDGIEVMSYEEAFVRFPKACFIVANLQVKLVVERLLEVGISKIHIVR